MVYHDTFSLTMSSNLTLISVTDLSFPKCLLHFEIEKNFSGLKLSVDSLPSCNLFSLLCPFPDPDIIEIKYGSSYLIINNKREDTWFVTDPVIG